MPTNPFRIGGTVAGRYFTDRADELQRITGALTEPQAKLLVLGPRRMGKSSALEYALRRLRRKRLPALSADLSATTAVADMASRLLQSASQQLRPLWKNVAGELVERLRVNVSVVVDPAKGWPTITLDVGQRRAPLEEQRTTLAAALDAIDELAAAKRTTVGVVLDEFQEIHRFGGEEAEWHLRGVIQRHEHVGYVLAGSQESLILSMTGKSRAFFKLFDLLRFGPIDPEHMARWVDSRLEGHGVDPTGASPDGAGRRIVDLAWPRTRDIVQLARAAHQIGLQRGALRPSDIERALDRVVDEEEELFRAEWDRRTALQQNALRAIAAGEESLYSEATRERYGLRGTAYVASAVDSLMAADLAVKLGEGRYGFDNPFMRRWVVRHALGDVGVLHDAGLERRTAESKDEGQPRESRSRRSSS
jgi:hypothetical protein